VCQAAVLDCDDGNPCTADGCSPDGTTCVNAPVADGTACGDADACYAATTCLAGACQAPAPTDAAVCASQSTATTIYGCAPLTSVGADCFVAYALAAPAAPKPFPTQLAGGYYLSLALLSDSSVWSWGANFHGVLGTDAPPEAVQKVPVKIQKADDGTANLVDFHAYVITAGSHHALAVDGGNGAGELYAWGWNYAGQLGDGTTTEESVPLKISRGWQTGKGSIAAGSVHSLAIKADDASVWAWGNNGAGQLGTGNGKPEELDPVQVRKKDGTPLKPAVWVAAGGCTSYAVLEDGTAWGWGSSCGKNDSVTLGTGSELLVATRNPVQVMQKKGMALANVVQVACSYYEVCLALKKNGEVWIWGLEGTFNEGSLGLGKNVNKALFATQVTGLVKGTDPAKIDFVAADGFISAAGISGGDLWTWGYGPQLGLGGALGKVQPTPAVVNITTNGLWFGGGGFTPLALTAMSGGAYGWGRNSAGQVGDGSTTERAKPVSVKFP
jgi:alpha-tubulin suppressor-like RCC1 family protein